MNQVVPHRPAPPDINAALCIIGDWAGRDKLSAQDVIDIFTDGFMQRHARLHTGLAQAIANTTQAAIETVAQGAANV